MVVFQTNPQENQTTTLALLCLFDIGVWHFLHGIYTDGLAATTTVHLHHVQVAGWRS